MNIYKYYTDKQSNFVPENLYHFVLNFIIVFIIVFIKKYIFLTKVYNILFL